MWIIEEVLLGSGGTLQGNLNFNRALGGFSIDTRTIAPKELFIALSGPRFDGHDYVENAFRKKAIGALVSRAAFRQREHQWGPLRERFSFILVDEPLAALQKLAGWHRARFTLPLIGITGSNGKTTTKEMTATILEQRGPVLKNEGNFNNHIGLPLTLLNLERSHQAAVVEMGINQKGEMKLLCDIAKPTVGLITNIGAAHLEGLSNLEGVAKEKTVLFKSLGTNGSAAINRDDRFLKPWTTRVKNPWTFGFDPKADLCAEARVEDGIRAQFTLQRKRPKKESTVIKLPIPGRHQMSNALGAATVATSLGFDLDEIREGLTHFSPPKQRMEIIKRQGLTLIFDAYNANPDSMKAALKLLARYPKHQGPRIAVLGEMLELGGTTHAAHLELGRTLAELGIDRLIAVGPSADATVEGARTGGLSEKALSSQPDLSAAAAELKPMLKKGVTLLIKGSRGMRMETLLETLSDVL